jgi:hypothetical protein
MNAKTFLRGFVVLCCVSFLPFGYVHAADEGKGQRSVAGKVVEGEISGLGKDYISIIYKKDAEKGAEYEILLPLDDEVQLVHKKSIKDLRVGDRVNIEFDEVTESRDSGEKVTFKCKKLSFVKPADKKSEDTVSLNLKGIKEQ